MRLGRLSIPEGLPLLINVNDESWCNVAVRLGRSAAKSVLPAAACCCCLLLLLLLLLCMSAAPAINCNMLVQEDGTSGCTAPLFSIFKSKWAGQAAAEAGLPYRR